MNDKKPHKSTYRYWMVAFILTAILVVLKLTGFISWSWLWVFSPIWISLLFVLFVIAMSLIGWLGLVTYFKLKKG